MSRFHSYLNSCIEILSGYFGQEPFAGAIKKFFAAHKKFGSRDRKTITHACYSYFRVRHLFPNDDPGEVILKGLFLCGENAPGFLQSLRPDWAAKQSGSVIERLSFLTPGISPEQIFPFISELSEGIDKQSFALSLLQQPDLFVRIRPGYQEKVLAKLRQAGLEYTQPVPDCIAFPNGSRMDEFLELNREVVVQDYSSQQTLELLEPLQLHKPLHFWDCCAASGGKAILAKDILGDVDITVSDVRESILHNLHKRFAEAGIKNYNSFIADLSQDSGPRSPDFDLILADVPCSGSGTWGRTPEQLVFFRREKIDEYAALQKKILGNVVPALKPGGHLLYITCSVFRKENEEAVGFLDEECGLSLRQMKIIPGYMHQADTMFTALLQKPL
ncbi:MAG: Fmu (Sun) domain-containing protein [Chitinophagaceae bacterium]